MAFPETPRVLYEKNPLVEVICQLRFPAILAIANETPAGFQDQIRHDYPLYSARLKIDDLPANMPDDARKMIVQLISASGERVYDFSSADGMWRLTLAADFLALTASKYQTWDEFQRRLQEAVAALVQEYSFDFYTRLGLRYRNVIQRSLLDLSASPWADLLTPHIAGPLAAPDLDESEVLDIAQKIEVRLPEHGAQVRVVHQYLEHNAERCYLIDNDLFINERTLRNDALGKLHYLNRYAGRIFRWAITERLHNAMEPKVVLSEG